MTLFQHHFTSCMHQIQPKKIAIQYPSSYICHTLMKTSWWLQPAWKIWIKLDNLPQLGINIKQQKHYTNHLLGPGKTRLSRKDRQHSTINLATCKKKTQNHQSFYTPQNLTWNLKMMVSKWTFLFQGLMFRFHVKFWGCSSTPKGQLHPIKATIVGTLKGKNWKTVGTLKVFQWLLSFI